MNRRNENSRGRIGAVCCAVDTRACFSLPKECPAFHLPSLARVSQVRCSSMPLKLRRRLVQLAAVRGLAIPVPGLIKEAGASGREKDRVYLVTRNNASQSVPSGQGIGEINARDATRLLLLLLLLLAGRVRPPLVAADFLLESPPPPASQKRLLRSFARKFARYPRLLIPCKVNYRVLAPWKCLSQYIPLWGEGERYHRAHVNPVCLSVYARVHGPTRASDPGTITCLMLAARQPGTASSISQKGPRKEICTL